MQAARVHLTATQRTLDLVTTRYRAGMASGTELDDAKTAVAIAEVELRAAQAQSAPATPGAAPAK